MSKFTSPDYEVHDFICGMPRVGKTYKVLHDLKTAPYGGIFFNPQEEDTPFIKASSRNDIAQIRAAIRSGKKIDYVPSSSDKRADKELRYLVTNLFENPPCKRLFIAVDECHVYVPEGTYEHPLFQVIRRGLKRGVKGYFISQSPAEVSKKIIRGCYTHTIFYTDPGDANYYKTKRIPIEQVEAKLNQGGRYSFCIWSGGKLSGPHKV